MESGRGRTLLLVEDEALIALAGRKALERYGYRVSVSHSGEDALAVIEAREDIDLVLMDIDLGAGIDGTETATRILRRRDLPIVFLSSHSEPEIVERTEKITSYGYVVKNSSITVLDASIKMATKLFAANRTIVEKDLRQNSMISNISDVIMILDAASVVSYVSPNVERLFGWPPGELVGTSARSRIHPGDGEAMSVTYDPFLQAFGEERAFHFRFQCRDGGYRHIEATATNLLLDPVIRGILINYHDISDRHRAGEALRERERMLNEAEICSHSGSYIFDIVAGSWRSSENLDRIFGIDAAYVRSLEGWLDLIHPDDRAMMASYVSDEVIGKCRPFDKEYRVWRADGLGERAVHGLGRLDLDGEGRPIRLFGTIQDIDAHGEGDDAVIQQKNLLRSILDISTDTIFAKDPAGRYKLMNEAGGRLLGYEASELLNRRDADIMPPELARTFREQDEYIMSTGQTIRNETTIVTKGVTSHLLASKAPWKDSKGRVIGVVGISTDITELKKAEAKARDYSERLNLTMVAANIAWWEMDVGTGLVSFDRKKTDMLGYAASDFHHYGDFMRLVHPDDREAALDAMRRHMYGQAERYDVEYRILAGSGAYVWFRDIGSVQDRDAGGRPLRVSGMVLDISERKSAEEGMRHEQQLMKALMDNVPEIIYFKDLDSRFIRGNKALAVALGLEGPEQAIGKTDFDFYGRDAAERFLEDEREILRTGWPLTKTEKAELPNKASSWNLTTKLPLTDQDGKVVGTFGISTDITEQVNAGERVKALLSEKELLLREVHHRIKNNFNNIVAMLSLRSDGLSDPEALSVIHETVSQIESMKLLYEQLSQEGQFSELPVRDFLSSLVHQVIGHFPLGPSVSVSANIDDFILDTRRMQSLSIILNELITNIMKYAFDGIESPGIGIIAREKDGLISISVSDNGRGMPESVDFEHSTGFGLSLIGGITKQLNGSIRIERGEGTKVVVEFEK